MSDVPVHLVKLVHLEFLIWVLSTSGIEVTTWYVGECPISGAKTLTSLWEREKHRILHSAVAPPTVILALPSLQHGLWNTPFL